MKATWMYLLKDVFLVFTTSLSLAHVPCMEQK